MAGFSLRINNKEVIMEDKVKNKEETEIFSKAIKIIMNSKNTDGSFVFPLDRTIKKASDLVFGRGVFDLIRTKRTPNFKEMMEIYHKIPKDSPKKRFAVYFLASLKEAMSKFKGVDNIKSDSIDRIYKNMFIKTDVSSVKSLSSSYETFGRNFTINCANTTSNIWKRIENKEINKESNFKDIVGDSFDDNNRFLNNAKNIEERMMIDAAALAYVYVSKDTGISDNEIENPWKVLNVADATKRAKNIKDKYNQKYNNAYKLLKNSYNKGIVDAKQELADGEILIDPLTGEKVDGSIIMKTTKKVSEVVDKWPWDMYSAGPKLAIKILGFVGKKMDSAKLDKALQVGINKIKEDETDEKDEDLEDEDLEDETDEDSENVFSKSKESENTFSKSKESENETDEKNEKSINSMRDYINGSREMISEIFNSIIDNTCFLSEADNKKPKKESPDDLDLKFDSGDSTEGLSDDKPKHKDSQQKDKVNVDTDVTDSESSKKQSPRKKLKKMIEPQVEIATSVMSSITMAFENLDSKKYSDIEEQIKSFEKQIKGACQQVISSAEISKFDTSNEKKCSPKAYEKITQYDSRDRSTLDLAAAIIVFNNSIKKQK